MPSALPKGHARTVNATELALKHVGRPLPNAALLGAFAALTGVVHLKSVADGDPRRRSPARSATPMSPPPPPRMTPLASAAGRQPEGTSPC